MGAQLSEARKGLDAERADLQGKLAEAEEQRNAIGAREAQAGQRAKTLQAQLQAAEAARGEHLHLPWTDSTSIATLCRMHGGGAVPLCTLQDALDQLLASLQASPFGLRERGLY